jgi:hypothetical protein
MELFGMRIPVALLFTLLVAPLARAQDLQLTMRMSSSAPHAGQLPGMDVTMYLKGTKLRIDQNAGGQSAMSMIYDSTAGKTVMLLHENRVFMETPATPFSSRADADSAALAAMGLVPDIRSTGQKQLIGGYQAERFVSVMRLPQGAAPGNQPTTMVSEHWLATDPALNQAFYAYAERMQMMTGGAAQHMAAWDEALKQRVPLKTTIVMVSAPANQPVDAEAVLRAAAPPGWQMRVNIELQNIKTTTLADSLFQVPSGYTQGALK